MPNALPYPTQAAFECPLGHAIGAVADVDLSAKQFLCMAYTSTGTVAPQTTAGGKVCGILQDKPKAGEAANVVNNGHSKVVAGGVIAAGDALACDTSSRVVVASGTDYVVGYAEQAASGAGVRIAIRMA